VTSRLRTGKLRTLFYSVVRIKTTLDPQPWFGHHAHLCPDINHATDDGSGLCAYMHRHEDIGYWKVVECSAPMASICEYARAGWTEPPPTTTPTPPPEAQCPDGGYKWTKFNDHCYRWEEDSAMQALQAVCCGSGSVCFWGHPDPDALVRDTDTDPDPDIIKQK
jgi:hypothetical protein